MAPKAKKKKQLPCNKKANSARAWPDLPQQLLSLIGRQSTLMQNISFGGITKSWRAAPRQCDPIGKSPWLHLSNQNDNNGDGSHGKTHPRIFNISFRQGCYWYYGRRPRGATQYFWNYIVGYSQGKLVAIGATPSDCYLWHPIDRYHTCFPPWDTSVPFKYVVLSSSPELSGTNRCMLMVLTGISHPAFVFCRQGGNRAWIKQDCTIIDPYASNQSKGQHFMQFTNAIGFKGKVYALSLQGTLAVIEDIDSHPRITTLGTTRAVPSVSSKHFREYLVEFDGEILLVFLISRKSVNNIDDVEVFRLNLARLSWVKIESLGDRTLFVGVNCCMFVSANRVGCRSNCVYFTHLNVEGWWVYDMERRSISPGWSTNNSTTKSPDWIEPLEEEQ